MTKKSFCWNMIYTPTPELNMTTKFEILAADIWYATTTIHTYFIMLDIDIDIEANF